MEEIYDDKECCNLKQYKTKLQQEMLRGFIDNLDSKPKLRTFKKFKS
jgi:hypothetical protein